MKQSFSLKKMIDIVVPPITLLLLYYTLSLFDIWEAFSPMLQAIFYISLIGAAFLLIILGLLEKITFNSKYMRRRFLVVMGVMLLGIVISGDDFDRLTTLTLEPRALFDYDKPEILATLTPPLYIAHDTVKKKLMLTSGEYESINPVYEGSVIDLRVSGTKWAPTFFLSDGTEIAFEQTAKEEFIVSAQIDEQTSWALMQGSHKIGEWPIILIDDEEPEIDHFALEEYENDKGYLSFKVDVDDDRKIMNAELSLQNKNGDKDEVQSLAIRNVRSINSIYYADFSGSKMAGQHSDVVLSIEDEAGQKTEAIIENILLPKKEYKHPVAGNLIALRQELMEPGYDKKRILRHLKALGFLGEKEGLPAVYYMALRSAYWRLAAPTEEDDLETSRDLLWDIAQTLEDKGISVIESNLLNALDELRLVIRQRKDVLDIREKLRAADQLFKDYSFVTSQNISNRYDLEIDIKALRRLYSYILAFSDQKKFYNASLIIDFMKKGLVQNDDLIFSRDGLGNYFALSESRQIIDNLIKIQKTLLASSYNEQMTGKIRSKCVNVDKTKAQQNKISQIALQEKVGAAVKMLGSKISFSGYTSGFLINNATDLVEEILSSMKKSETAEVSQSQSELIAVMSNLKRVLNKPVSRSTELQNILKEINSEPVS